MPKLLPSHSCPQLSVWRSTLRRRLCFGGLIFTAGMLAACSNDSGSADEHSDAPITTADDHDREGAASPIANEVILTKDQLESGKIAWDTVSLEPVSLTVVVPGQIVPNEDRTARIGAPASGRVVAVHVRPGERVEAEQLLATMRSPEGSVARAEVAKAEAQLRTARSEATYATSARDRAQRLLDLKALSRQEFERAVADDEAARSALSQAQSELARARATALLLGATDTASADMEIRAPQAGVVLSRTALPGTFVESGSELVAITDPSSLWLSIASPERHSGIFAMGGTLRFTVPAFPADTFSARIDAVGAGLDPQTRTLNVRAVVQSGVTRLRSAMFASVLARSPETTQAVVLPRDAVQLLEGKQTVFIAQLDTAGGAKFIRRDVDVLPGTHASELAVTRGLAAGDIVVTRGAFAVKSQLQKGSAGSHHMDH